MNQINCVSSFFGRIESLSMAYNKFVSPFYVRKMYILCLVNWSFLNKEICNSCIWCTCNVNKNLCKNEESGLDLLSDIDVFLEIAEDVFPLKPYFEIKTEKRNVLAIVRFFCVDWNRDKTNYFCGQTNRFYKFMAIRVSCIRRSSKL